MRRNSPKERAALYCPVTAIPTRLPAASHILPRAGELLPQRARAVDYVVAAAGPAELEALIHGLEPARIVRLEGATSSVSGSCGNRFW